RPPSPCAGPGAAAAPHSSSAHHAGVNTCSSTLPQNPESGVVCALHPRERSFHTNPLRALDTGREPGQCWHFRADDPEPRGSLDVEVPTGDTPSMLPAAAALLGSSF